MEETRTLNPNKPQSDKPAATGIGAAAGGAAGGIAGAVAAGAAVGGMTGPVGAVVGAAVGAVAGGLIGRQTGKAVDPTLEDTYWRDNYSSRPYVGTEPRYDDFGPAYRYGVDAYTRNPGRRFEDLDDDLSNGWNSARGTSTLDWANAKHATKDAWQRVSDTVERAVPGDSDRDGK